MVGDRERYLATGMDGYVSKPINRLALYQAIETLLGERLFARTPPAPVPPVSAADEMPPDIDAELDAIFADLKG